MTPRNSMSRYNHIDRMNSYSQYNFKSNDDRGRRQYHDRNAEEPEWFSGGPTSQNDTIELRGFEEYRQDSPVSHKSGEVDDETATADYESDTDKGNDDNDKANDDNNNDNDKSGNEEANHREANAEKANDFEAEDLEAVNNIPKPEDHNFNFDDFLKVDNLTDILRVNIY